MSQTIELTQGDSGNETTLYLTDHDSGVPIDLTDVTTVDLKFRAIGSTVVLQTLNPSIMSPRTDGKLMVTWPAGALDVDPGFYEGEITLNKSGGKEITVYRHLRFFVQAQF